MIGITGLLANDALDLVASMIVVTGLLVNVSFVSRAS
jgi:hypothetical protein